MTRWRQGGKVPHHVYQQRGDEPDRRPYLDGDPPIAMFLDPADAMTAVLTVNAIGLGRDGQVRVSPDGFVAQRFDRDFNGAGNWVLTYLSDHGIEVKVLNDIAVADWPRLEVPAP